MCLAVRPRKTREALTALQKNFPEDAYPSGVPSRVMLQALRPKQHTMLSHLEKLLATGRDPAARLTGRDLSDFRDHLRRIEGLVRRGVKDHALEEALRIRDGHGPTMSDVARIHAELDRCGRNFVQQAVSELRRACRLNTCPCCPAESVPLRVYRILPQESADLTRERKRMMLAKTMYRGLWRNPLGYVEDRGFLEGLREQRNSIATGGAPGFDEPVCIPYEELKSPEIRQHVDLTRAAGDMASRLFPQYYFQRSDPDQRCAAERARPVAPRLVQWMNDIRNFVIDEINAMSGPELDPPLPRIQGVGYFPDGWIPPGSVVTKSKLDLAELEEEFKFLMQYAHDHREDEPVPTPKSRRRPALPRPHSAKLMPRPIQPKPPRKKQPRAGKARPSHDRPPPRAA